MTPLALSAFTAPSRSSQVLGGVTPASASTFLLLKSSTGCVPRIGTPYGFPFTDALSKTDGRKLDLSAGSSLMKSSSGSSRSASTKGLMLPPPQLKKMSGACGVLMMVCSFCW